MAWNPESKTVSDSHTWVGKGLVSFFATFSVVISASQEIRLIYHTHDDFDIADPSSTQDARHTWTLYTTQLDLRSLVVRASDRCAKAIGSIAVEDLYYFLSHVRDIRALGNSRFQYFSIRQRSCNVDTLSTLDSVTGSFWFTLMHARKPQMVLKLKIYAPKSIFKISKMNSGKTGNMCRFCWKK